jgi:hypothetical protein
MSHRFARGRMLVTGLFLIWSWGCAAEAGADLQVHISRASLAEGETTSLEVVVKGPFTGVRDPEFDVPAGLEVLGSNRSQSLSSINGQSSIEIVYQYEIGANRPGSYELGPFRVRAGSQLLESPAVSLLVAAARPRVGSGGDGPGSLAVEVSPAQPYVGQPVVMRVRLVQRASLAEDPSYAPPSTAKFWAERASQPESYYADDRGRRVLVTETRTRLYPLAAGDAMIGEATATLVMAVPESALDPLQWLGGRVPRRESQVRSNPLRVRV